MAAREDGRETPHHVDRRLPQLVDARQPLASVPRTAVEFAISQGTRVLYAAESNRQSYEADELEHGVFTYFLVKGLRGDASATDGFITFDDLARYVTRSVQEWGITKGRTQLPHSSGEHSGDFLIAVRELAATRPAAATTANRLAASTPPSAPVLEAGVVAEVRSSTSTSAGENRCRC